MRVQKVIDGVVLIAENTDAVIPRCSWKPISQHDRYRDKETYQRCANCDGYQSKCDSYFPRIVKIDK